MCISTEKVSIGPGDDDNDTLVDAAKSDDILDRVLRFIEDWECRIHDNEFKLEQASRIEKRIEESLDRQLEEAVITRSNYSVIKDVTNSWMTLLGSLTVHHSGNKHLKLQIVTLTLKLYRLGYISHLLATDILTDL